MLLWIRALQPVTIGTLTDFLSLPSSILCLSSSKLHSSNGDNSRVIDFFVVSTGVKAARLPCDMLIDFGLGLLTGEVRGIVTELGRPTQRLIGQRQGLRGGARPWSKLWPLEATLSFRWMTHIIKKIYWMSLLRAIIPWLFVQSDLTAPLGRFWICSESRRTCERGFC